MRRTSALAVAFLATAFLTGGHCGNEITAPLATPTPVPTVTPTPAPAASLTGDLHLQYSFPPPQPPNPCRLPGQVTVDQQGMLQRAVATNTEGQFSMSGLVAGPARISGSAPCQHGVAFKQEDITLQPGQNTIVLTINTP